MICPIDNHFCKRYSCGAQNDGVPDCLQAVDRFAKIAKQLAQINTGVLRIYDDIENPTLTEHKSAINEAANIKTVADRLNVNPYNLLRAIITKAEG